MEQSGKERRRKPRFNAELSCDIAPGDAQLLSPDDRLECRTRDLSETGVGVVVGSIYVGYTCVVDEGRTLQVRLALPAGDIEMEATSAHYIRLDTGADQPAYLIGLRITSMSEDDRTLYNNYLEELSKTEETREQ
jgi:c-di-GMP-binding flagellar brake protein YcgR